MVRVSIDVVPLTGAINQITTAATTAGTQQNVVNTAASRAYRSVTWGDLTGQVAAISDAAEGLQARLDLAVIVNSGDDGFPTSGVLTYDTGSGSDSVDNVKFILGQEFSQLAQDEITTLSPALLSGFNERFGRWTADDSVMMSFYADLGPEGLLTFTSKVGEDYRGSPAHEYETQMALLGSLRTGLHTASGAWSPLYAEDYARELVREAVAYPGEGEPYNQADFVGALNYFLYESNYSSPFLTGAVEELDQYERVENDGTSGLWSQRPPAGWTFLDDAVFNQWGPSAGASTFDPMTAVFTALDNNPAVALQFFDDTDAGGDQSRVQYYVRDRNFDADDYTALVQALDAASTDPSLIGDRDSETAQQAALLASRAVQYFSEKEDGALEAIGNAWQEENSPAAQAFAHLLTTYMPAVDVGIQNDEDGVTPGAGMLYIDGLGEISNMPNFGADALADISGLAMSTDDGFAEVRLGLNDWRAAKMGSLADGLAADPDDLAAREALRQGMQQDGVVEGFFIETLGNDKIQDGAEKDARIEAWVDFGSGALDVLPIPGVKQIGNEVVEGLIDHAVGTGKDAGYDAIKSALATNEGEARSSSESLARETVNTQEYMLMQLLADRGLTGAELWTPAPGETEADRPQLSEQAAPGQNILSYEEFLALDPDPDDDEGLTPTQSQVLSELFSVDRGVGEFFNRQEYEEAYLSKFVEYFPDPSTK